MKTAAALIALTVALGALSGCGDASEQELLASAKKFLSKQDAKSAVIQLKSALQVAPSSGEARYLLGKTLLDNGDAAGAAVELGKADSLGYEPLKVAPSLARALLTAGDYRKLTLRFGGVELADKAVTAEVQTSVGRAHARLGETSKAETALRMALLAAPGDLQARLFKAQLAAQRGDADEARAEVDSVLASTSDKPTQAEAWLLRAQLLQNGNRDPAPALAAYRQAISIDPALEAAHEGAVLLLLQQDDASAAKPQVAEMTKRLPQSLRARYLDARVAYRAGDFARTREITTRLLQAAPTQPVTLELAGAAEYMLKAYAEAETHLSQALQFSPRLPAARLVLAQTYLRTGQPATSLTTIRPLLDGPSPSAEVLAIAGEASLMNGDAKTAESLFRRAAAAKPGDARLRTELAVSQLAAPAIENGPDRARALGELDAIAANDAANDNGTLAQLALISEHLRQRRFDKAMKAVDALAAKQPGRASTADLRGRVQLAAGDRASAKASFDAALRLDPTYFPAVRNLAAIDLATGGPAAARQRLEAYLTVVPKQPAAMLAIADLAAQGGASTEDVAALTAKAVAENPTLAGPRIQLIDRYAAAGDMKRALSEAQNAASALPADRDILFTLARTQLRATELQQAASLFSQLAAREPLSTRAWMGLAEVQLAKRDRASAVGSLQRALELAPDLLAAQRRLVELAIADQRGAEGLAIARKVQQQRPDAAIGHRLEGDVLAAQKKWDDAIAAYRSGLKKEKSPETAVLLHATLVAAGRRSDAETFATAWQREQPADPVLPLHLGDLALSANDLPTAERQYRTALKAQPESAVALNNIAWTLHRQGKPGALELAERANQLAPDQAPLLDTLAGVLEGENKLTRAAAVQRMAVARAPDDPALRLNLARMLVKAGNKAQARVELDALAKLGEDFTGRAEVVALQKQL